MNWKYIKNKGIQSLESNVNIFFNTTKNEIDKKISENSKMNNGRNDNEFCYSNLFNTELDIRLNFENEKLKEIEILEGAIIVEGVKIKINSSLRFTAWKLRLKGNKYFKHTYGYTFPDLKIDLGDRYENGGDRREICWFYTAENIDHLLDEKS